MGGCGCMCVGACACVFVHASVCITGGMAELFAYIPVTSYFGPSVKCPESPTDFHTLQYESQEGDK